MKGNRIMKEDKSEGPLHKVKKKTWPLMSYTFYTTIFQAFAYLLYSITYTPIIDHRI